MPLHNYRPDLMGSAEVTPQGEFEAGSWAGFSLIYTCGKFGIDDRGSLKIVMRGHADMTEFQLADSSAPGYVSATASNGAPLKIQIEDRRSIRPWNKSIYIQCQKYLSDGDTITINIGDRKNATLGIRLQTFCEDTLEFRMLVDPFATYDYIALPDNSQPTVSIVPGPPAVWKAILPTLRRPGSKFRLSLKCEDRWGNPSDKCNATIRLIPSHPINGLPDSVTFALGEATQVIDGLTVDEDVDLTIAVIDSSNTEVAESNPLRIRRGVSAEHFWSDMHGQSEETIGTNSARDYFLFGRDKAFLDIIGHQGNDFQVSDSFWEELNKLTAEFNQPGRFVTIPGYEWSGNTGLGGDHNVWYRNEGRPIYRSSRALVNDTSHPETDCHSVKDLFAALAKEDAIITAHVGGRYADVKYAHDAMLEPSVEVHSAWGSFDWIIEDALSMGYRVGIVCSSDGHKGRPGASYPGDSMFGSYGGLTCHLLPELNRDTLFEEFRRRHHYGTTGARLYLHTSLKTSEPARLYSRNPDLGDADSERVTNAIMGDILSTSEARVSFTVDVVGTTPIERIEIKDGIKTLETVRLYRPEDLGNRVRIACEGAKYRGRGRLVKWKVKACFTDMKIIRIQPVNFWNPDSQPTVTGPSVVTWNCVTTGGASAVDVWLDGDWEGGLLDIETNQGPISVRLADIGYEDHHTEFGGLRKGIRVYRLPHALTERRAEITRSVNVRPDSECRLYARVTQEDGHLAWSSPIYVIPESG